MKIKRLFAAILSAMMIVSCFSFTANAQETQTISEPLAIYAAKDRNVIWRNDSGGMDKTLQYDAVTDRIYYRATPVTSSTGTTKYDSYGITPAVTATNGAAYLAYDVRTNVQVKPSVTLYNSATTDGGNLNNTQFHAATATVGNGEWERVVITISGEKLEKFTQVHQYIFGRDYSTGATTPADAYMDMTAFAFFADEYSAKNYDFSSKVCADGEASFSVGGTVTTEVPEEDPTSDGERFTGWSTDSSAASGDPVSALTTVPAADGTTYYAIFVAEDDVEDESAVYISANGDDENSGRHSAFPVKTLDKANDILAGDGIDTLYVIGNVDGTGTPGLAAKKIYIEGYSGDGSEVLTHSKHWKMAGDIEFSNITLTDAENDDGQFMAQGHNITINNTVKTVKTQHLSQGYYNSFSNIDNVVNVNGGTWNLFFGPFSGSTITGKTVYNIDDNANIKYFSLGKRDGYTFKGESYINVDGGTVAINITNSDSASSLKGTHTGLRYFTLNGGTVSSFYTRSERANATLEGITVFEINDGVTITPETIAETKGTTDDSESRVVIFNDGVDAITVGDTGAIVVDVTGGSLAADVTVASDYTATLNGFTYETLNYYDTVKIGETEYDLAEYETLPASLFAAGVNTVEFFEAETAPITTVYVSDAGDDANKGDTAEAPLKTMKAVRALLDAEGSVVDTVYLVGTVTITADDATTGRPSISIGAAGRKIKYLGYGENAILDARLMPVYLIGEVEMDNFTFHQQTTYDGKLMAEGHNITIGEGMKFGGYDAAPTNFVLGDGTSTKLTNFYYALKGNSGGGIPTPLVNTITINGSKIASVQPAIYSGDATFKGEVTLNLNKKAEASSVRLGGQGYNNVINTYGTIIVNVNDEAKIGTVESEVGGNSIGNYSGLREININGGNVGTIKTTAKASSSKGTATKREQLMVVTVNGGTLGAITKPVDDENENSQIVVIFNDGVDAVEYADAEAYILDVTGGMVEADTTVSEDYTTATLNKFTYTVTNEKADRVVITAGETTNTYALAELNGAIALDKLAKGTVNEIVFEKTPAPAQTVVYVSATGADTNDGKTADTAVATLKKAYEIVNNEDNAVEQVIIVGEVTAITNEVANWSLGQNGKTLKITGADATAKLTFSGVDSAAAHRVNFYGNVTLEDITLDTNIGGEVPYATGTSKSVTIGKGVKLLNKGANTLLAGGDYADPNFSTFDYTFTVNGTDYAPAALIVGAGYAGDTKTGSVTAIVNAGTIPELRLTKGSTANGSIDNEFRGTVKYEINGGKVDKLNFGQGGNFKGFGHMVINGGEIGMLYTKSVNHSWASWIEYPIALTNAGVFVFEINGGTINRFVTQTDTSTNVNKYIAKNPGATGYPDTFANVKRVVIFNDGVTPVTVEDTGITYVLNVTGGKVTADVTVAEDKTNATLNKFKFTTTSEEFDQVTIKVGENTNTYKLADLNGEIALDKLTAGTAVHEITFSKYVEAPKTANATFDANGGAFADGGATKTVETVIGETPVAPEAPVYDGYTFKGWTPELVAMVAEGAAYTAVWEKNAPTTATLKFYDGDTLFVEKTVAIGATADVFPIQSDKGRESKGSNDIFAYPDNASKHFLGWSTDGTAENIVVRETYTATADEEFYAVWEDLDLLTAEEITVTNIVTADDFTVPADAEKFEHLKVDNAFTGITTIFNADGTEYKAIGTGEKYPGLGGASTTINSYVGSLGNETATVLFPAGSAMYPIWMKFNDGKVIGAKTTLTGEVNVAFVFNASPSNTTAHGFYISAGDVAGTYNLTPENKVEGGSTEFLVTLKTTVEAGDLIAFAAPYNFDNNTVKAAQLEAIYVWKDAPVVTTANATFNANGGAWGEETTKTVVTNIGETPVAPEAPVYAGYVFKGWTPELKAMDADGETYTAVWEALVINEPVKMFAANTFKHFYVADKSNMSATKAVDADTKYAYYRYAFKNGTAPETPAETYSDSYANLGMTVENGLVYYVVIMRTNQTGTPNVRPLQGTGSGDRYYASAPLKADGTWERVVIKMEKAGLTDFKQMHMRLLGEVKTDAIRADFYYDIAGYAFFNDEYSANNYDFTPYIIAYEEANAVYVNASAGDDANSGRTSKFAVKTLQKAEELLKTEGLDTLYVIGNGQLNSDAITFGVAGKTIKVRGYNGSSDVFDVSAGHLRHTGSVDYDNVTLKIKDGDGRFMAQGNNITIGTGVVANARISQFYYGGNSLATAADSTITLKAGTWANVHVGNWTDGSYYGTSTIVIDGATVGSIKFGHGSGTKQTFNGTGNVILNNGTVSSFNLDSATDAAVNSYNGLRYFTLNGGKVTGNMTITSKDSNSDGSKTSTATGVTVIEINAPGILDGNITKGKADDPDAQRIVIYNNDSYVEGKVTDADAIVIKAIGAKLHADITVADDFVTTTHNGYTYELPEGSTANAVKIGEETTLLADLGNAIPASKFAAGVNTVEFVYIVTDANATFNANGGKFADGTDTKTVKTAIGEVPAAPEAPTKAGYTFAGWTPELTAITAEGATYTAKWTATPREFGANALYVDTTGSDENDGLTPETAIKTLTKAQAILKANKDLDTVVVVGTYSKTDEGNASLNSFGKDLGRKIYITGYTVESVFDMRYFNAEGKTVDSHFRIYGDIEIDDIIISGSGKDGGFMSMGYELTFGENVTVSGAGQNVGVVHYNAQYKDNGVVNVLSGKFNKIDIAIQSGDLFKGTSTINIGGTANTKITNGHGWKSVTKVYGINNVNINGGNVTSIQLSSTADTAVTSYAGLRYYTINAGTVGNIYTTGSSVSNVYDTDKIQTATERAGVTVFEINGGTVGAIKLGTNKKTGEAEADDATRVVILNNGMNVTVEDTGAIVVKTTGGNVKAVTNAYDAEGKPTYGTWDKVTADWAKAIKLTGFSYELPEGSNANAVKIDGGEAILLENYANDIITGITTAGEHTVEFVTVEITEPEATNKVYIDQANGNDENNGETAASAVKTIAAAQALLGDEDLDTLVIVGQFLLPDDDAKNTLGYAGKTITITGFDSSAVFAIDNDITGGSKWNDERLPLAGAVVFENITIIGDENDARIELNGNNFTFGDGVKFSQKSVNENNTVSVAVQSIPAGKTPEITVKSGTINRLLTGPFNAGTVSGTVNINVAGKDAFVQMITIAHNYNANNATKYGITNVTVDDGAVTTIGFTPTGTVSVANYDGLRHYVINGGSVANIELAGIKTKTGTISGKESTKTATLQSGVNVVEINGGAVGKIYRSASDIDDSVSAIIFNNGTYAEGIVTDTTAIVADVKGGTLTAQTTAPYAADATAAQIQEWSKTVAITGYAFTTDKAYVRINGTEHAVSKFVSEAALTAEEVSGVIPADKLTAGYNSVLFTDTALITVNWTVDGETVKTDSVDAGTAATAPEAPAKDGYTFKGWAVDGTTEIIDTFAFTTSTTLVAVFEKNVVLIDVKWIVDGEEVKAENVEAGSTVTAPASPVKDGFTFKGWAIEGTTEIIDTFTFTTSTTLVAVFEEIPEPEETAIYKTYGVYDEETGTYTVELKVSGVKAHTGSFGFVLPGLVSVTAAEGVTLFAEEEAAGAVVSPIFAKGEDFYANTWAIEAAPGYIDATQEEVLIATFVLEADASFPEKFEEYVVDFADAKYFANGHYLVAPKSDALDTDKIAVIYESHTDSIKEIEVPELGYKTYGTYNPADGSYTIEVKFIGGKINAGAFGIAFNSDYMTYDPEADGAFVLAEGIANYLDVALENTADGIAFVWDGSADAENGFVDATDAEVLIATIKAEMSEDQRAAYEAAGTPAFELLDITGVEDAELYFNGTDYLVALYADDLAVERVAAKYIAHADEEAEVTTADVTVKVTFADKAGATTVNLGYITVNGGEAVVIDDEGNEEATAEYVIEGANVGETLTIKVEKNGYLAAVAEVKVSAAGNTVEITTVAGDIKESTEAISGDGEVDLSDFIRVVRAFDENATDNYKNTVDLNEDGAVNVTDLGLVKANFNKTSADVTE